MELVLYRWEVRTVCVSVLLRFSNNYSNQSGLCSAVVFCSVANKLTDFLRL